MGINQFDRDLRRLHRQQDDNTWQQLEAIVRLHDPNVTPAMRSLLLDKLDKLYEQYEVITSTIKEFPSYYRRPSGRITGLFSRVLGPLPHRMKNTEIDQQAEEVMASLPSYRFAAFGLLFGVITTLITLSSMFPWLVVSPFSLFMNAVSVDRSSQLMTIIGIVGVLVLSIAIVALRSPDSTRRFIYIVAHDEEKCFRSGSENWTPWQRFVSCVSFGSCHVVNIIYPLLTLAVLSLVGAAFMAAYLGEHRRSGDVYRATLAATKLHARYNIFAMWFTGILLALVVVTSFL